MSNALLCRVIEPGGGECFSPGGECDQPAAVGLVVKSVDLQNQDILELHPICTDHAPEQIHEASISMDRSEWAIITLAWGTADGALR